MKVIIILAITVSIMIPKELSHSSCDNLFRLYPRIILGSKSIRGWKRTLTSPSKANRYGLQILTNEYDKRNAELMFKCLDIHVKGKKLDYRLGSYKKGK